MQKFSFATAMATALAEERRDRNVTAHRTNAAPAPVIATAQYVIGVVCRRIDQTPASVPYRSAVARRGLPRYRYSATAKVSATIANGLTNWIFGQLAPGCPK